MVKTELRAGEAEIVTTFAFDGNLQVAVPVEMRERYFRLFEITGVATYGRFRRFEVRTDEQIQVGPAPSTLLVFASFFGAAIRFRRRPDVHKRLMTIAATTLLVAAVGRMSFLPAPPGGLAVMFLVWSSPVLLAVVYDSLHGRGVHPVYITGLVAFAFRVWSEPLALTSLSRLDRTVGQGRPLSADGDESRIKARAT